jgi:hypothetical protein
MYAHSLRNINDQFHVGVVVVVRATGYLHVLICHPNVVGIRLEIFWCRHDGKLYCPLISKCVVCPFSHRSNLFDRCNTVIGNEHLECRKLALMSNCPTRIKILTDVMTECPSFFATKSFTAPEGATSRLLPPMKWEGRLALAARKLSWPLTMGTVTPFVSEESSAIVRNLVLENERINYATPSE